jgi:hypothetical protein
MANPLTLFAVLFTALAIPCTPVAAQDAQQLLKDLERATDGYEVADQSRAFADVAGVEAMEARVEIFDQKLEIKGGPNLRDWLVSGMIKARTADETEVLAQAAANKKNSTLLRLVSLRALRRGKASVVAKPLMAKSFQKADVSVQREWQRTVGTLLSQKRLELGSFKGGVDAVRSQLLNAGAPFLGFASLDELSVDESNAIVMAAMKTKDVGDLAQMIHVLAEADSGKYSAYLKLAGHGLRKQQAAPRIAVLESALAHQVFEVAPLIVTALEVAEAEPPGRYLADYAAALRALTGQQFGTRAQSWRNWWQRDGEAWLKEQRANGLKAPRKLNASANSDQEADTVAQMFGIPIDSSRVAIVIDGSGSMNDPLDHRNCAQAAADELESFLSKFPKDGRIQLHIIVRDGQRCFKKVVASTDKNCRKAVEFVRDFDYGAASSMYDVLIEAQEDVEIDTMLFISDGGGSWGSFAFAGHMLDGLEFAHQRSGVRVHAICVGSSKTKQRFMRDLAEATGGKMKLASG